MIHGTSNAVYFDASTDVSTTEPNKFQGLVAGDLIHMPDTRLGSGQSEYYEIDRIDTATTTGTVYLKTGVKPNGGGMHTIMPYHAAGTVVNVNSMASETFEVAAGASLPDQALVQAAM